MQFSEFAFSAFISIFVSSSRTSTTLPQVRTISQNFIGNMTTDQEKQAIKLLKETSWFHDAPDSLLRSLAGAMVPVEAPNHHLFVEEGENNHNIVLIEEGTLVRTKLSLTDEAGEAPVSLRKMSPDALQSALSGVSSIRVDEVSGRGRITGLLHNIQSGSCAYATISADGPVKVWIIKGEDFRGVIASPPENALAVMHAMSRELRVGSKSLRGLMQKFQSSSSGTNVKDGAVVCRVLCYDTTSWVSDGLKPAVEKFNAEQKDGIHIDITFTTERLSEQSATYAAGYDAVCCFVNDNANSDVIQTLSLVGVKCIAMRCAGFDRVDTRAATAYGLTVCRVPAYSPYAVAEMAIALLMAVNRKIIKASNRVKMANFTLDSGLMGMDIHGKTVGVMGTGTYRTVDIVGRCFSSFPASFSPFSFCPFYLSKLFR
jgi:CRP-like cAMP-binding protein